MVNAFGPRVKPCLGTDLRQTPSLYGIMRYFTVRIVTWFTLVVYFVFKAKETEYALDHDQCNGTTD